MSNLDFDDELEDSLVLQGSSLLVNYGWYIVGLAIFYFVFRNKINEVLDRWYERSEESNYAAKYHKNPDLARSRIEGLEAARQKMQEDLNRKAVEAEIRKKELMEKKLAEKLMKNGIQDGYRLSEEPSTSKNLKADYYPLMSGANSSYKPPKRSCCKKGGGCG